MKRAELETKLHASRIDALAYFLELSPEELGSPRTQSEHDPDSQWSALDHLSHLAFIEERFVDMVQRHLAGHKNPVGVVLSDEPRPSREAIMARVHELTENDQRAHHHLTANEVVARTCRARATTLALLGELSDDQLAEKIPGAPWADGTVGGVLGTNADHAKMHTNWVRLAGEPEPGTVS